MRQIKFRAWDKFEKEMFTPSSLNNHEGFFTGTDDRGIFKVAGSAYQVQKDSDYILMQYTGFKDGLDVEIFEDDLLENDLGLVRVIYDENNGWFAVEDDNFKMRLIDYIRENDFEVVGNVYQYSINN